MAAASEHLTADNLEEAALLMRAAAAYSTALKNTSDLLRHTLRIERVLDTEDAEDLPELVVMEITAEQALQMRQERADEMGLGLPAAAEASGEAVVADDNRVEEGDDDAA